MDIAGVWFSQNNGIVVAILQSALDKVNGGSSSKR
jgi:hypothetical protein